MDVEESQIDYKAPAILSGLTGNFQKKSWKKEKYSYGWGTCKNLLDFLLAGLEPGTPWMTGNLETAAGVEQLWTAAGKEQLEGMAALEDRKV